MTLAKTALGTVLTFGEITVGEIQSISGTRTRNIKEILSCDSTNTGVEKIAGALNEGEVTFHCIYDGPADSVYDQLNTVFQAKTPDPMDTCLIVYPDTNSHSCKGIISSLSLPSFGEADGEVSIDVTIAFSGKAVYTGKP